jgi:hypothetical protein
MELSQKARNKLRKALVSKAGADYAKSLSETELDEVGDLYLTGFLIRLKILKREIDEKGLENVIEEYKKRQTDCVDNIS